MKSRDPVTLLEQPVPQTCPCPGHAAQGRGSPSPDAGVLGLFPMPALPPLSVGAMGALQEPALPLGAHRPSPPHGSGAGDLEKLQSWDREIPPPKLGPAYTPPCQLFSPLPV